MMQDDDDDDDDNDDPMILNNRAKNHTSERTIVPWTVIFELGVRTIGSRLRIRSAASHWLEYQVFLLSILILFVFLFCCQFLLQGEEQGGEVDGDAGEPLGDGDVDGPKEVMGSCEIGEQVMAFQLLEYHWQEGRFDTLGKLVSAHPGGGQHPTVGCCPRGGWVGCAWLAHLTHPPRGLGSRLVGG